MLKNARWKIAQIAELIWWKRYLKHQNTSEYLLWKRSYWLNMLKHTGLLGADTINKKVIDLGCGPAGIFMVFNHAQIEALDPLLENYESNLPHFKKHFYPAVKFHSSSIEEFNSENKFDYVFCLNAINHVTHFQKSLDKVIAMTSDTLIISIDAHNKPFFKKLFRLLPLDILHPHQYDLKEYQTMINERGCTILQTHLYKKQSIFNYYVIVAKKHEK